MAVEPVEPVSALAVRAYDVTRLREHLPEAVSEARDTKQAVLITDGDEPLAAIVSLDQLDRLHELEEAAELRGVISELEEAEARGEKVWYTHEEMLELQAQLLKDVKTGSVAQRFADELAEAT
jgi:prevent-host-death family protein